MRVFKKLHKKNFDPTNLDFGRDSERRMLAARNQIRGGRSNATQILAMKKRYGTD